MFVNTSYWQYLGLDDHSRRAAASACAYLGMTPEQILPYLDQGGDELARKIELATELGFQLRRDIIRVLP